MVYKYTMMEPSNRNYQEEEMQSTTITPQAFNALSTFEQKQLIAAHRAGRSNLQCVKDIFGDKQVPYTATAFHTDAGKAIFLDTAFRAKQPYSSERLSSFW